MPQNLYNKLTGVVLILLSTQMLVSYLKKKRKKDGGDEQKPDVARKKSAMIMALIFGLLGGAMSGLIGLSRGGPIVAGLAILGCGGLETVGTSVLVLLGISITGFAMHLGLGSVDWELVGLLIIGTISGAFAGPILLKRINKDKMEKVLQPVLLVMTVAMGILLLFK